MKIKTYIKALQKLADKHPNAAVVYAIDGEGNSFQKVEFVPTVGLYNDVDNTFYSEEQDGDDDNEDNQEAICLN